MPTRDVVEKTRGIDGATAYGQKSRREAAQLRRTDIVIIVLQAIMEDGDCRFRSEGLRQ